MMHKGSCKKLLLQLLPAAVSVQEPELGVGRVITVDKNNCVKALVSGHHCRVKLDSGTSKTVIFRPLACALGLVRGGEKSYLLEIDTWEGRKEVEVVCLPQIVILLAGSVEVKCEGVVLPECLGKGQDMNQIVLDVEVMRRGHAQQAFYPGGSLIVFQRPDLLCALPPPKQCDRRVLTTRVQQGSSSEDLSLLVDTGCVNFSISRHWERKNRLRGGGKVGRVALFLGYSCALRTKKPSTFGSTFQDFVLGLKPLQRYKAILDYHRHSLTFTFVGRHHLKVDLQPKAIE